jgi:hypothetical protein
VHFLATSYSFVGDYAKAMEASRELLGMAETPREQKALENLRTAVAQGWFSMMGAMVQFRKWDEILGGELPKPEKPRLLAWYPLVSGAGACEQGELSLAAETEAGLMKSAMIAQAANKGKISPEMKVAMLELQGQLSVAVEAGEQRAEQLEKASRGAEAQLHGASAVPRPVSEALGNLAMRHGRADVAEKPSRRHWISTLRTTRRDRDARFAKSPLPRACEGAGCCKGRRTGRGLPPPWLRSGPACPLLSWSAPDFPVTKSAVSSFRPGSHRRSTNSDCTSVFSICSPLVFSGCLFASAEPRNQRSYPRLPMA